MKLRPFIMGCGAATLLIGAGSLSFAREKSDLPSYSDLELMAQIMTLIDEEYVEPVEANALIEGALDGALSALIRIPVTFRPWPLPSSAMRHAVNMAGAVLRARWKAVWFG